MTEYERALLTGHYLSFSNNNGIDPRLLEKGYSEAQLKEMRRHMGDNSVVGLDFKFSNDLKTYKHPSFNYIYTLYDAWLEHHALPFEGAYTDQPNKIIEHFIILDQLRHETEKKMHQEAMKEARNKGKK